MNNVECSFILYYKISDEKLFESLIPHFPEDSSFCDILIPVTLKTVSDVAAAPRIRGRKGHEGGQGHHQGHVGPDT